MEPGHQGPKRGADLAGRGREGRPSRRGARGGGPHLHVSCRRVDGWRRERAHPRRRRGKPEPYAPTTIPGYRRDLNNLLKPRFGERPADGIDEREWQDFFDDFARQGLSHSRLASVKAVASSIYAWALHRTRRHVTSNPLRYIELPPNLGKRRERVALAEEAERLLALLDPKDQVPYGIAFYAGLRRGEIDRLDWLDVDISPPDPGPAPLRFSIPLACAASVAPFALGQRSNTWVAFSAGLRRRVGRLAGRDREPVVDVADTGPAQCVSVRPAARS
jgi:hypothetical protein